MRRSTGQNAAPPSTIAAQLLSSMNSATENNARVRSNTRTMKDKVESARRHLSNHQRQFHTGEDSSGGESVENRSPHHRSRSSPRTVTSDNNRGRHTSSVLYSAELQHVRRKSGDTRKKNSPIKKINRSPAKSISPARNDMSFHNQSMHDFTLTESPRRRSTYVVGGKRDSSFSYRGDATFTAARRETFTIDRRDETTVSHDETVIAPGLLEEEFHPRRRDRAHSHGSTSVFHSRCTPKDAHPHEVSNPGKWEIDFLPGSLRNASMVEKDRRSAALDLLTPNAEALRYQEERTRREEEELMRLVREQTGGRTTKEIFDNWVPLDEERRKRKGGEIEDKATSAKKSTRRLWAAEGSEEGGVEMLTGLERRGGREERRVVVEDEAGYAMPLQRDTVSDVRPLRTPSPTVSRGPSPDEQFFTPATSAPRLSRVSGGSDRRIQGETPVLGRHSTRLSSTFVMDRSPIVTRNVNRLRGGADEADRSVGSSFHPTPDRRDESLREEGGGERSMGEYATPIGRRATRRDEEENSFLNTSAQLDRSRGALNESMRGFEANINRSLEQLSFLATRLSNQLEVSRANLSSIGIPTGVSPLRDRSAHEGAAGERRLGMEASILSSLSPMREERHSMGGEELRRAMQNRSSDHRISLPERREEEMNEERVQRHVSPLPRGRTPLPSALLPTQSSSLPHSSVAGLASLLDANIGRMERTEGYEREAHRLEEVVREINQATVVEEPVREKPSSAAPVPPPRPSRSLSRLSRPSSTAIPPVPRPRSPLLINQPMATASPRLAIAIDNAGGRDQLMEMYEARHRNWNRRADDSYPMASPRSPMSRSPSPIPLSLSNPAELRERQSVQGMLDQRAKAVRGAFLHLLQKLYHARFATRYDEKNRHRGNVAIERAFAEEQKRQEESFRREAAEAKAKAIDPTIKYRDFMQWLKETSERMEREIEYEVDRRERRRMERKEKREETLDQNLLSSSRLAEASALLDEREKKALRARENAQKHMEKREQVRRLEMEARRAVALAEIPSSARSSIDDASFLLQQQQPARRYSIGNNEPLRVTSAREGPMDRSMNASRDGRSMNEADKSIGGGGRKELMSEMKERLEQNRRQAEEVRRAMKESERRMSETEMVSVAAQLAAHDEYIRESERVGRVIAENVQPRSPIGLPPGVEPLDLSSLDEDKGREKEEDKEEGGEKRSTENSADKSTDISGKMGGHKSSSLSSDSLDAARPVHPVHCVPSSVPPSIPSSSSSSHSKSTPIYSSSSSTSSSSSNKTLRATEELSQLLEEVTVTPEEKETKEEKEKEKEGESVVFSPLSETGHREELDRSLPSTAPSTGRQELTLDTVPSSLPVETPNAPVDTVEEEESIPEEIVEEGVGRSSVPSRALFSPIESSTTVSSSEESEESRERRGEREEKETAEMATQSLKKAISVASEMANPFDGFESSSGGSRKSAEEEKKKEEEKVTLPDVSSTTTTVVEKIVEREDDEISWGDGSAAGALEVGGGSARSADFDWGLSPKETGVDEKKEEEVNVVEKPPKEKEKKEVEEEEETISKGKIASLRDRLNKINLDDDEGEKKSGKTTSSSSSSTATSSSSRSTSSSATTSTGGKTTTSESSGRKEEIEDEEKTPRVASISGGLSSASGSVDFDDDVNMPVVENASSRSSARTPSRSRFRLSLDDSFPDSPRDTATPTVKSSSSSFLPPNGRVMAGAGSPRMLSPRVTTPTSPHTPRSTVVSAHLSPASPDARKSRFSAVMPASPRSGRRSTSPKHSLSREVSFAQDDSSFGDISRLSAVEIPNSGTLTFPPILSSLPPLPSSSFPSPAAPSRPSIGSLNGESIDEGDEMEESYYDLMDIKAPASVLSSLPIAELIGENDEEEEEEKEYSPPETLTARSNLSAYEQYEALNKMEFIRPRIEREADQIWRIIEQKGWFTKGDEAAYEDMDVENDDGGRDETITVRNERIRQIRAVSVDVAASMCGRDVRKTNDGIWNIPAEIVPLRRLHRSLSRVRLTAAIENELKPMNIKEGVAPPHTIRMRTLGVEYVTLPVDERSLNVYHYANEDTLFHSDLERGEIVEELMRM